MSAAKKWAIERHSGDEVRTELMTDQELDRASASIAAERAQGQKVDLRLATEADRAGGNGSPDREHGQDESRVTSGAYQKPRSSTEEGRDIEPERGRTPKTDRSAAPAASSEVELER